MRKKKWRKKKLRALGKPTGPEAAALIKKLQSTWYSYWDDKRTYGIGAICEKKSEIVEKLLCGESVSCTPEITAVRPRTILRKGSRK